MPLKTSPIPDKHLHRLRLEQLKPVNKAVEQLRLPLIRFRKLNGILNALTMQIEDGGDSPEVNTLLVQALRSAIDHQVGLSESQAVLEALDAFEKNEMDRWQQLANGTLPRLELTHAEQLLDLIEAGYDQMEKSDIVAACRTWKQAWDIAKSMARPEMRTRDRFSKTYRDLDPAFDNWSCDFMFELYNAGLHDRAFCEYRLQYIQEFFNQFPDEDEDVQLNFGRGRGEAFWQLGKQAEAEAVYNGLIERLPDEAWAYIGWADQYWLMNKSPKQYERAEAIMQQALARHNLKDRVDVVDRLTGLYKEWGKPEKAGALGLAEKKLSQRAAKTQSPTKEKKKTSRGARGKKK